MSDARQASGSVDPFAGTVVMAGGAALLAALVTWSGAQLCQVLSGAGWQHASFDDSPGFLVALLTRHDVRRAWGSTYPHADALTQAWLFWLLVVVITALLATVGTVGLLRWTGNVRHQKVDPARWATRRQERRIAVDENPATRRWRLVAGRGRASRRLLAGNDCVSAVVFGPNGSGKTTSLIVPNVLDWDGPVVMTTAKPQDLEPICSARAAHGPVWVIAPGGAPGQDVVGWSPIDSSYDDETADRIAEWMVESSGMNTDPKARPWNAQARKYLKGLLLATHLSSGGVHEWTQWIYSGERARDTVEDILLSAGNAATAREYASTWQIHEEGKGSVLFTALGLADTYSRPGVRAAADAGGFQVDALFAESGTLCIVTPSGEGDRFAPYFTALVSSIIHAAETRAADAGGPITPRLLMALDEAGNVFRYPRLPHLLTTARGNGVQLLLVYHDIAQVEHLYGGREVARTVLSNAKMRMLLPGVGDLDTLRYWSELMGQTRTQTHGETHGEDGRRSRSRSEHTDALAPLHLLQQLPDGQGVLIYQNLPPARVRLLPWFKNRRYHDFQAAAPGHLEASP
jgi:type IV secretion system protein VirD4